MYLQALLKKFSKGPQKVRTQICIAMAALAVHVPVEDWGGGGIVNWLSDEMNSQQDFIPSFLELLTVLPQVHTCLASYGLLSYTLLFPCR
jgi:transportin-3